MAMTSGSGARVELNVTPLIDVLLVLLVIFLLISPAKVSVLTAESPQPPKPNTPPQDDNRSVVLAIKWNGEGRSKLELNRQPVGWEDLRTRVQDIYKTRAEKVLFIAGDKELDFQDVASAIDLAKAGDPALRVGLMPAGSSSK